ncbi:MAG: DinB family protein [Candidatus Binatia bacterium]
MPRLDDERWHRPAKLFVEGKWMRQGLLGEFLSFLFFGAIHHRGRLSTRIRPMGDKVPSIYGSSGDDPGQ